MGPGIMGEVFWRLWCYIVLFLDGIWTNNDIHTNHNGYAVVPAIFVGALLISLFINDVQDNT